jgi:wobble nucleotide-excising tRNase
MAVFNNFIWDKVVLDSSSKNVHFSKINIIYGRNYSGKTTLSRILRAFERGIISNNYDSPEFSLLLDDGKELTQREIAQNNLIIRVFNEDFVRDNLQFIINQNEGIVPFAVLGDDNIKIEAEIKQLEIDLGSDENENKAGLFLEQEILTKLHEKSQKVYNDAKKSLDDKKQEKATGRNTGIKYKPELAEPNYNLPRLEEDIKSVLDSTCMLLNSDEKELLEKSLHETKLAGIQELAQIDFNFDDYCKSTSEIITKKIGTSDKIVDLLREAALNKWVKEGCELHKGKPNYCAFCGNKITDERWSKLNKHFDEESNILEKEIDCLIDKIKNHIFLVERAFTVDKQQVYSKYQKNIEDLVLMYQKKAKSYTENLEILINQLNKRKNQITIDFEFHRPDDLSKELEDIFSKFETIRSEVNNYSSRLSQEQSMSRDRLRLHEVCDFVITVDYNSEMSKIVMLKDDNDQIAQKLDNVKKLIDQKKINIQNLKRQLNNEEKGAAKVNEYLNSYFGHPALSLQAVFDISTGKKQIKFEIVRDGKKASDLSEGECSLIAFCYFMAKLYDVETKGKRPIIWIDDPISSLDSNHIFFVYSLIAAEIANKNEFEQLFVSTHSLEFLRYLKRLNGKYSGNDNDLQKQYFIINQSGKFSAVQIMPNHIKEYITEFNYLFGEIYKCATVNTSDDSNFQTLYNFGNNARKFLEIYLFYKYPDNTQERVKMERFFGSGQVPVVLTERFTNEYSHLKGGVERASLPIEVPEVNSIAQLILERLEKDKDQYFALLNSIGISGKDREKEGITVSKKRIKKLSKNQEFDFSDNTYNQSARKSRPATGNR